MKIDWKHLATTPGYISLRAVCLDYIKRYGDRERHMKLFNWVICRAKHYAHHQNRYIGDVLNRWEKDRNYSWNNFYQNGRQPKLNKSSNCHPSGERAAIKFYKTDHWYKNDPRRRAQLVGRTIAEYQKKNTLRPDRKKRWSKDARERAARRREYLAKQSL